MKIYLVFTHNRRHKTLHKTKVVMKNKVKWQGNKPIHLENSMVVYGVYNANTLEILINTIHQMHDITTPNERLLAGKLGSSFLWYLDKNGIHHYTINILFPFLSYQCQNYKKF